MTDGEKALDEDILECLRSEVIPGNESRSWQSLSVIAFKLAEQHGLHAMPDVDLKEFTQTIRGRLLYLCSVGTVRAKALSPGLESPVGFQAVNILDTLAEIPDEVR